jgi:hypothetical protein
VGATWPLPALLAWGLGWLVFEVLHLATLSLPVAIGAAVVAGAALTVLGSTAWRRAFIALGFLLSLTVSGAAGAIPSWAWLLPLALLAMLYPINAWRDAPLFPTPAEALRDLAQVAPLPAGALLLDAGCGMGDGLRELRREYPNAVLHGLEWSWPLRLACAWRCRDARVRRADIWPVDWSPYALVYLFQRPESMERAAAKALRELRPGPGSPVWSSMCPDWRRPRCSNAPTAAASGCTRCRSGSAPRGSGSSPHRRCRADDGAHGGGRGREDRGQVVAHSHADGATPAARGAGVSRGGPYAARPAPAPAPGRCRRACGGRSASRAG